MLRTRYVMLFILITGQLLFAQLSVDFSASSYLDDNIYNSPTPEQDLISDYSIYLNFNPESTYINYYYDGSYVQYNNFNSRNFLLHEVGIYYYNPFGKDEQNTFYLGGDWTKRIDTEENYYYDYSQLYTYANLNFTIDDMFLKTGYNFRYRSYDNLPDLTNYRNYLFVQANKSFQTRTSVTFEADLGYKSYAGVEIFEPGGGYTPPGDGGGSGGGGRRHGMSVETIESTSSTVYTTSSTTAIPSMGQVVFLARVAQSLIEKMGIFIQYRKQISLTPDTDYKNLDTQFIDEELFDDPFSYESETVSSQLTWMLPWTMKIQVGGSLSAKNYLNETAFISAEDTVGLGDLRLDDKNNVYVNFSKNFFFKDSWISTIRLRLNYSYIRNESNSYWYDYRNSVYGGGIEFNF
ncbi:hypothetical protein KAH27_08225 [bacterium]|nr:hypothetical protein [bacterium]